MNIALPQCDVFIPDDVPLRDAIARTTHLGIGAHPDDLEILAIDGILACYDREDRWFAGVTVTDGGGTPRTGAYANHTDEQLRAIRLEEQRNAAAVGCYGMQLSLGYSSAQVKDAASRDTTESIAQILEAARPRVVYTHNLWDKHDTHVAVALRVIEALRQLPDDARPERVYGVEVWRDLDWLPDDAKVVFDCSEHTALQLDLINAFASQVQGAKRYDRAVLGRRQAHATYLDPHRPDTITHAVYAVDMTPLIDEPDRDIAAWADAFVARFAEDVRDRVARYAQPDSARRSAE